MTEGFESLFLVRDSGRAGSLHCLDYAQHLTRRDDFLYRQLADKEIQAPDVVI